MAAEIEHHENGDYRWNVITTNNPSQGMPERAALIDAGDLADLMERVEKAQVAAARERKINYELRQEITRLRINAEKDVCSGCMQREEARDRALESARQTGVKYESAKQRWYEAKDHAEDLEHVIARVENLRDKWLAWPVGDMHHAAGLMLAKYLSDEPPALDDTAGTENG
ncbi:hypothetical protein [Nonomuraea guangzhouensis]|uniref:Uncharacterized protein n=1 Tax=Nonomuraea guangzhouensis TaxID=1291555 RepID=A0ABW4GWV2_9ACTN|nr:hypothetical protein [Nonomuraea guangzhouensis]